MSSSEEQIVEATGTAKARDEGDRIDEQMHRAGGAPDERELLGEAFDAENGAGASDELFRLAAENTGLPACPFCGGELCAVVLADDVGGRPGVSCGSCGAYTPRLPWREPWLYEGRKTPPPPASVPSPPEPECCQTCGGDGYTESFNADHSDVVITLCTDCGPGPGDFDG